MEGIMTATYTWYNDEKTIMYELFEDHWTWLDFSECIKGAIEEIRAVDHDVLAIADYTHSSGLPIKGASIKLARDVMQLEPDNWKGAIIVSNNRLIRTMVNLFQSANRTFGNRVYLENTVEDAIKRAEAILANMS
jgi:hypothetical protein